MESVFSFGAFGVVMLLAAISPGPDFLVVVKNSLGYSRSIGIVTALGVGSAIFVHVAYTIVGIGLIVSQSILIFSVIKILGAVYLCYLGLSLLRAKEQKIELEQTQRLSDKTVWGAFREGFLTNLLNPKAAVFFVSVFSQIVSPKLPLFLQSLYGIEAAIIVSVWFSLLAVILSYSAIRNVFGKFQTRMLQIMGVALILLGIRLAFSKQ
ncbi:MAG TPA: LysE family transporter [Candidatus Paceibacterota bacterium]